MENHNKFNLKQFALFSKGWYFKPRQEENSENIWEQVKTILRADQYMPDTKNDVLSILVSNITPFIKKDSASLAMELISSIEPNNTHTIGYFTKTSLFYKNENIEYDYKTAVLYYYMYKVNRMDRSITGKLPKPDLNIMPLTKELTETDLALFKD